jgi:hypothetical protein
VREPRVIRLFFEQRLEQRRGVELTLECEIGRRCVRNDGARVKHRRFPVFRMCFVQRLHRLLVTTEACEVIEFIGVAPQCSCGIDVHLLAVRGARREPCRPLHRGMPGLLPLGWDWLPDEWIPPERHRHAPMSHRAVRIGGSDLVERLVSGLEPERVQHRRRTIDLRLHRWRARRGKRNTP